MGRVTSTVVVFSGTLAGTAEAALGNEINISYADKVTLFINYTKGAEGTVWFQPKFGHTTAEGTFAWGEAAGTAGNKTLTANKLQLSANADVYHTFDVSGLPFMRLYAESAGSTANGTVAVTAVMTEEL